MIIILMISSQYLNLLAIGMFAIACFETLSVFNKYEDFIPPVSELNLTNPRIIRF